jgi:ankyrin repeat protein
VAAGAVVGLTKPERAQEVFKAAASGNLVRLAAVIAAGFDPLAFNDYGQTAVAVAAEAGKLESIEWLVRFGVDLRVPLNDGCTTALRIAQLRGHADVVALLGR